MSASVVLADASFQTSYALAGEDGALDTLKVKLRTIQHGSEHTLRVLRIGDSLAGRVSREIEQKILPLWYPNMVHASQSIARGGNTTPVFPTTAKHSKEDYSISFVGSFVQLGIGEEIIFAAYRNQDEYAEFKTDLIRIPYIKGPDAGRFRLKLSNLNPTPSSIYRGPTLQNGELIVDANSDQSSLDWIEIHFTTIESHTINLEHIDGNVVKFLYPSIEITSESALNHYHLGDGSNNFDDIQDSAVIYMAGLIEMLQPDIIITQADDSQSAYENFLPKLKRAIEDANLNTKPAVILVGEGPKEDFANNRSYTAKIVSANSYQRVFASDVGWSFIDLMCLANDMDTLQSLNMQGDGIHLADEFYLLGAQAGAAKLALYPSSLTYPTNDLDSDGLTDLMELLTVGSHPLLSDTDQDTLDDRFEFETGLSPLIPIETTFHTLSESAPTVMVDLPKIRLGTSVLLDLRFWESEDLSEWQLKQPEFCVIDDFSAYIDLGTLPSNQGYYRVELR